jgi:tetratricopeptide (TPR) repeat protein
MFRPTIPLLALAALAAAQQPAVPPSTAEQLLAEGQRLALGHAWEPAIAVLDRALAVAPDDPLVLRWRGHALTGAERYADALADLDRAVALDDGDAWSQYARAMALHHLGRDREAIDGYGAALALDPEFYKAREWRGFCLSVLGDHLCALGDLDAALVADQGNVWLRFVRAKAYVALLEFDRAEADLWLVLDADGRNADAHAQLGYLYASQGRDTLALRMLRRAVELDAAAQAEARTWLHHLLGQSGDATGARAQLDALADAGPWLAAVADFLRGREDGEGLVSAAGATASDPAEARDRRCAAWLHIGMVEARSGATDAALAAFARAIATDARGTWEWSWTRAALRRLCGER